MSEAQSPSYMRVIQALVVTSVVTMPDERFDLGLKVTGQEVISSRM